MTALNNQTQAIEQQEAALMAQLEALKAKKAAVASLEDEYQATIEHVKSTMSLMTQAGLDARNLLKDLAGLIAPATVSNRSTRADSGDAPKRDNTKRPGDGTQGGRAWALFDQIQAELGTVTTGEVKIRSKAQNPYDEINNVIWHLGNWRKAQQATALVATPVTPIESPTPAPKFEIPPAPEVTEAEAKAIDKQLEAEAKKSSAKKVK